MSPKEIYDFCIACQSDEMLPPSLQSQSQGQSHANGHNYNNADQIQISVTLEDIQKPSGPFVQSLYGMLLGCGWYVRLEEVERGRGRYLGMMAYKEMYGDALYFAMFYKHVKDLVIHSGFPSFTYADLLRPEPLRFRNILTAVANYIRFREEYRGSFQEHVDAYDAKQNEVLRLEEELDRIKEEIQSLDEKQALSAPLLDDLNERNRHLQNENAEHRQEQLMLHEKMNDLKVERAGIFEDVQRKASQINDVTQTNERIKSRIVKSPERIKRSIDEMVKQQQELRGHLSNCSRKSRELSTRLDVMRGLEVDLEQLIQSVGTIDVERQKLAELKMEIQRVNNELTGRNIELNAAESRIEQLDRQIELAQEKHQRQKQLGEDLRVKTGQHIDQLKAQYAAKARDRTATAKVVEGRQAEKKGMEDEMKKFREEHKRQTDKLLGEYASVRETMEMYMDTMSMRLGLQNV